MYLKLNFCSKCCYRSPTTGFNETLLTNWWYITGRQQIHPIKGSACFKFIMEITYTNYGDANSYRVYYLIRSRVQTFPA